MSIWDMLASTWPAQLGQTIAEALMAPGNAYKSTPDNPVTTEQMVKPAADLAGLVTGGSFTAPAMKDAAGMGIRAYHGSPYDFNKFDLSKVGTGEGAQAYGHGLYFAENPEVAQQYRDAIAANRLGKQPGNNIVDALAAQLDKPQGRMYEVNINAHPDQFLNWDAPLSQQSEVVRNAAREFGMLRPEYTGQEVYRTASMNRGAPASPALNEAGIPGIKYLDQGSRVYPNMLHDANDQVSYWRNLVGKREGAEQQLAAAQAHVEDLTKRSQSQTNNYVVFDPNRIDIIRKWMLALGAPGAAALGLPQNPNNQVIGF